MTTAQSRGRVLAVGTSIEAVEDIAKILQTSGFNVRTTTRNELRTATEAPLSLAPDLLLLDAREQPEQAVTTLRWVRAIPGFERLPALLVISSSEQPIMSELHIARGGLEVVEFEDRHWLTGRVATLVRLRRAEEGLKTHQLQHDAYSRVGQTRALDASVQALRRLANEWGNVLMDVQVASTVISETLTDESDIEDQLQAIRMAISRGQQWIRDIGVFRLEAYDPQMIILRDIIDRHIGCQFPSLPESLDVQVRMAQDLWPTDGDPELLELALGQLISNAVESMDGVGMLAIDGANVRIDPGTSHLESLESGAYVRITVSDTGIGIPKDIRARVFEPFFTTKTGPRWKGLGLAQAQFIARRHGGIIVVHSDEGVGSRFTMLLPRSQSIAVTPVPDHRRSPSPPRLGFLIVDDQPRIAHGIARLLRRAGHIAIATSDADSAVALYGDHRDEIDYVILDINLGDRSGFDIHRELEICDSSARIVLVTGYASPTELAKFSQRERTNILEKPFGVQELLEHVKKHFPS